MTRKLVTLASLALFSLPTLALAGNWQIDSDHSAAHFKVQHMMIADVRGHFPAVTGVAVLNEQDITRSTINVSIEAASINTGVAKRDDHLKSPDFFDVARYPTLSFASRQVTQTAGGQLKVRGELTIHGVTKEVELLATPPSAAIKDPWGNTRKGVRAETRINRKDFGIIWNATLDNGGLLIGDEVDIVIDLELIEQAS